MSRDILFQQIEEKHAQMEDAIIITPIQLSLSLSLCPFLYIFSSFLYFLTALQ